MSLWLCATLAIIATAADALTVTVFQPQMLSVTPPSVKAAQLAALNVTLAAAAAAGSDLVVLPELYLSGYNLQAAIEGEPVTGPSVVAAKAMAQLYNISLVFTFVESESDVIDGKKLLYDSALFIYRNGSILASYRKVNLAAGEDTFLSPGSSFAPVIEVEGVRIGLLICFDIFLPEPARILARENVALLIVPTANGYPAGVNVLSSLIIPTRGLENNAFVVYTNWVQDDPSFPAFLTFHGQSTVSDPSGSLLYVGPSAAAVVQHVFLNFTNYQPGSTVQNRPEADTIGLC